jgi:hypothetical protein
MLINFDFFLEKGLPAGLAEVEMIERKKNQ